MTERDGLSHHIVHAVHRDREGFLWLGTEEGLDRYDGARVEHYGLKEGFPSPSIRSIAEDSAGMFWLGTTKGLVRFDPVTRAVKSWPLDGIRDPVMDAIIVTARPLANGDVICTSDARVQVLHVSTGKWTLLIAPDGEPLDPFSRVLLPDSNGTGCWISTHSHNLVYYHASSGLLYGKFNNPAKDPLLDGLRVSAMARTPQGDLWFYDDAVKQLGHYRMADRLTRRWPHIPAHPELPFTLGVTAMHLDGRGRIWASGWDGDPFLFDPADSSAVVFRSDAFDPGAIGDWLFNDPYEDENGVLWIPTRGGLSIHDPRELAFRVTKPTLRVQLPQSPDLSCAVFENEDVLWLGTESGLIRHDLRSDTYTRVTIGPGPGHWNNILDMLSVGDRIWIATRSGVWVFDPRQQRAELFTGFAPQDRHLAHSTFSWLLQEPGGALWLGTWHAGIARYEPSTRSTHWYRPGDGSGSPHGPFHCAKWTSDGALWIGHGSEGLIRFDPRTQRFERFNKDVEEGHLVSGRILGLAEDAAGHLWIGADIGGLIRYDRATRTYTTYGREHGLRDLAVEAIQPDDQGRIWVGSRVGLCYFDPATEHFTYVSTDYGQPFADLLGHSMRLHDGQLYFTNRSSAFWFDPAGFISPEPPPAPRISRLSIDGVVSDIGGDSVVRMIHGQRLLAISYGVLAPPGAIRGYALRRTGGEWDITNDGTVSIQGIEPGTIELEMKVMSREGLWSKVRRLSIVMDPPWWQLLWVRVLTAVLLAGAIVLFFRLRLNAIRKRERKEEGLARAMNELRLRALRAQMDPHFIFNCLNSIDKYILMEQGEKASHYLNRFARLVRLILNQSDSVRVSLEREAEMLRYYIELECLRFKKPFTWDVKVDPQLLLAETELPTMLVQPYVENAIWHGLQHKPETGHLTVEFRKLEDQVECVIEDNGIGREASARINAERMRIHQSKSMQVNADRMKLLEETNKTGARVEIIDLKDRDGKAIGTRARIVLPIDNLENEPIEN